MQDEQTTLRDLRQNLLKVAENLELLLIQQSSNSISGHGIGDTSMAGQPEKEGKEEQFNEVKGFADTLGQMLDVHRAKCHDYAGVTNPLSNFDVSEYGLGLFKNPRDQAFVWPIFTKLARLSTLLNSGNAAKNESIEDSLVDIANYVILWKCDMLRRKMEMEKIGLVKESFKCMGDNRSAVEVAYRSGYY